MKNKIFREAPELTRVSSKGQVVIPQNMRLKMHIREGSMFAVSSPKSDLLVLKKVDNPMLKEDLAALKEVEEAWEEIEKGKAKELDKKEFLKELEEW